MTDAIAGEAFSGLTTALQSFLPPSADPDLAPALTLNPTKIRPTGLNGFVGTSADPAGEIVGRYLEATALVEVKAASLAGLDGAVGAVTQALVGASPLDLRKAGIFRLRLASLGAKTPPPAPADAAVQAVSFDVAYEFLKEPSEGEGVIAEIPLDVDIGGSNVPHALVAGGFAEGALDAFDVVDDPSATSGPSQWVYDAVEERIRQLSSIGGGTAAVNANKPGTALLLRTTPSRPAVQDALLRAEVRSEGAEAIGLVYRFHDTDNYGFFLMNQAKGYRLLGVKVGGAFRQLDTPALDSTAGFDVGRLYRIKLVAIAADVRVFLDEQLVLHGSDPALQGPGRWGLTAFRNPQAAFHSLDLTAI
jgi:hypothetical protein